ncbi:MAG: hypothetical protein J6032_01215 [Bacteroidales bacterium]|nr:hypothetical protein [Bacteroidales bacterium]
MKKYTDILFPMLIVLPLAGCSVDYDMDQYDVPVNVSMSFTVSNGSQTRQADPVVQEGSARDIEILGIIPFAVKGKITRTDRPKFFVVGNERDTYTQTDSRYFYYENCSFISGVASFLVYGKAQPASDVDAVNGALIADFPADLLPAGITFSPKQIYGTNAIHTDAQAIADYLTDIANTEGWATTSDTRLQTYYQNFIGNGSVYPSVIAGSSANVKAYVTHLKNLISAESASSLKTKILESIDFTNFDTHIPAGFPGSIGLPDGAAALRWEIPAGGSEYAFVPQTVTTAEAAINSLTRFTYPAELYYYGNSRICTSTKDNRKAYYDLTSWGTSNSDANTVLSGFENDPGEVTADTKAIAIKEPVQYAVARLDVKIKAQSESLQDARETNVSITNSSSQPSFPMTGIVVGSQYTAGFDFAPIDNSDTNVRFAYDNQVNTNTGSTPFCLSTTEQGPTRTLLLQSPDGEDVMIVLEFRNNSDKDFTGVDGIVYKGTKFYLVGKLQLSEATGDDKTRVFTQDQTTTAKLRVDGLAKAYNVMPNLLSPRLEIGVTLTTDWEQTTPTIVVMEKTL